VNIVLLIDNGSRFEVTEKTVLPWVMMM